MQLKYNAEGDAVGDSVMTCVKGGGGRTIYKGRDVGETRQETRELPFRSRCKRERLAAWNPLLGDLDMHGGGVGRDFRVGHGRDALDADAGLHSTAAGSGNIWGGRSPGLR